MKISAAPVDITNETCRYLFGIPVKLRYFALCMVTFQTTAAVVLTRYSKTVQSNDDPYFSSSLVVSTELAKLILSLGLIFLFDTEPASQASSSQGDQVSEELGENAREKVVAPLGYRWAVMKGQLYDQNLAQPLDTLKLSIPALLYTIQNNLIYVALENLEATTFQVGYQSKVITTAVMSVLLLNRSLSRLKWTALVLLTIGIVLTQLPDSSVVVKAAAGDGKTQSQLLGIFCVLCAASCSAFAGVYFEKIIKGSNPSLWMRNAQLASFSLVIGLATFVFVEGRSASFFQGYNELVWAIIAVQAGGGLFIALVMKYADNILKGFATAISIILCGILSGMYMGFVPNPYFLVGSLIVICATFMYSM
jgi:UDP-sugar transporter A1/2/3